MSLAVLAFSLAIVFVIVWRLGLLDELSRLTGGGRVPRDPDEERRLEVFKDFFSGDPKSDE